MSHQTATAIISNRLTPTQIKQRICEYREASRPFIKILVDLKNTQLTKMTLLPNGKLEIQYTDEYHRLKKQIDEHLEVLQKEILPHSLMPNIGTQHE